LRKLTLSVDEAVIERARRYSRRHNTSISRLVSSFLAGLGEQDEEASRARFSPAVERLLGVLPEDVSLEEYREHLEKKLAR
jgi:hypothetical protein